MKPQIKHIVIFGADGFASHLLEKDVPRVFQMLMQNGAYTLHHRSVVPVVAIANWTSIFTGVSPSFHGRVQWSGATPELSSIYRSKGYPQCLFQLFKQQTAGTTAVFFRGDLFKMLFNSRYWDRATNIMLADDVFLAKQMPTTQCFQDLTNQAANGLVVQQFCEYLQTTSPQLSFVYVNEPDVTGHEFGYQAATMNTAANQIGLWVEEVLAAIQSNSEMQDNTLFVFVSDHGGKGKGSDCHGSFDIRELATPLFFYGQGVVNPGQFLEASIQYDLTATLGWLLDLELPLYFQGKVIYSPFVTDLKVYYEQGGQ